MDFYIRKYTHGILVMLKLIQKTIKIQVLLLIIFLYFILLWRITSDRQNQICSEQLSQMQAQKGQCYYVWLFYDLRVN